MPPFLVYKSTMRVADDPPVDTGVRIISHGIPTAKRKSAVCVVGLSHWRVTRGARRDDLRMDCPMIVRSDPVENMRPPLMK
jgi:hypothetical protein